MAGRRQRVQRAVHTLHAILDPSLPIPTPQIQLPNPRSAQPAPLLAPDVEGAVPEPETLDPSQLALRLEQQLLEAPQVLLEPIKPLKRRVIDLKVDLSALYQDVDWDMAAPWMWGLLLAFPLVGVASLFFLYWRAKNKQAKQQEEEEQMLDEERIVREKWRPPLYLPDAPLISRKPLEYSEGSGTLIVHDPNTMTFSLNARSYTYAFRVNELQELEHLHWGAKLDPNEDLSVAQLNSRWAKQHLDWIPVVCGDPGDGALQRNVFLHEWADHGTGDYRRSSYMMLFANGSTVSSLKYYAHKVLMGKPTPITPGMAAMSTDSLDDAQTLVVTMFDEVQNVFVDLHYTIFRDSNVMVRKAIFTNASNMEVGPESSLFGPIDTDALEENEFAASLVTYDEQLVAGGAGRREEAAKLSYAVGEAMTLLAPMTVTADFEAAEASQPWHITTLDGAYE
eukprot:EG_transcript_10093